MKVLVFGDAEVSFIKQYVASVLIPLGYDVYIGVKHTLSEKDLAEYTKVGAHPVKLPSYGNKIFKSIPFISGFSYMLRTYFCLRKQGPFDIIHVHYISKNALMTSLMLKTKKTKIVASFWGSDLFRKTDKHLKSLTCLFDKIDVITYSTKRMLKAIRDIYSNRYDKKLKLALFGSEVYRIIDSVKKTKSVAQCRTEFGLPQDKFVVAIGYNKTPNQQADIAIRAISQIDDSKKKNLHLFLQMGYGTTTNEYLSSVQTAAEQSGITFTKLERYVTMEELAQLRYGVDIFINTETTDAFSASMQEYLSAGATVMNPQWLVYDELDDNKVSYINYKTFENLPKALSEVMDTMSIGKRISENADIIWNMSSWEANRQRWNDCYGNN